MTIDAFITEHADCSDKVIIALGTAHCREWGVTEGEFERRLREHRGSKSDL